MPGMPRENSKATRIAYDLIGVPANLKKKTGRKKDRMKRYDQIVDIQINQLSSK